MKTMILNALLRSLSEDIKEDRLDNLPTFSQEDLETIVAELD